MAQVVVRTADRVIVQWSAHHTDHGGCGMAVPEGCALEDIDGETLERFHAESPAHGGGMILSEDHAVLTAAPEPGGYRELLAARGRREADLALVRDQAAGHPDPLVQALARLAGVA